MWQIFWILNLLPDWVFHTLLGISVLVVIASYILKRIPFVSQYNTPLRVVGILLIISTVWIEGGRDVQHVWEAKVNDLKEKVVAAKIMSEKTNTKIQTRVVTKIKEIEKQGETITQYIDREVVKYDSQCTIPKSAIIALNAAATGKPLKEDKSTEYVQLKMAMSLK